jgi:hypothetical protein
MSRKQYEKGWKKKENLRRNKETSKSVVRLNIYMWIASIINAVDKV